jgi:hypothetical protein
MISESGAPWLCRPSQRISQKRLTLYPMQVRLMAQFDALYTRRWPAERLIRLASQVVPA